MRRLDTSELAGWVTQQSQGSDRYLFGIAGPPGSGKSTIATSLGAEIGAPIVPMDGFHLTNATLIAQDRLRVKGAPETFAADDFVDLVRRLRAGDGYVDCPVFDRVIDEPVLGRLRVGPDDTVVIVEGNYLLLDSPPWSALSFDAVAYLDVPDDVRIQRLIDRHIEFGRSRREAAEFVRRSDQTNSVRVEATRSRADVVVALPAGVSRRSSTRRRWPTT